MQWAQGILSKQIDAQHWWLLALEGSCWVHSKLCIGAITLSRLPAWGLSGQWCSSACTLTATQVKNSANTAKKVIQNWRWTGNNPSSKYIAASLTDLKLNKNVLLTVICCIRFDRAMFLAILTRWHAADVRKLSVEIWFSLKATAEWYLGDAVFGFYQCFLGVLDPIFVNKFGYIALMDLVNSAGSLGCWMTDLRLSVGKIFGPPNLII